DGAIRLLAVELADKYGQAARRGIVAGVAVIQSGSLEAFFNTGEEGFAEAFQRFRRQLFGAQFDQEVLCTHSAASLLLPRTSSASRPDSASLARTSSRSSAVAIGKPRRARASR